MPIPDILLTHDAGGPIYIRADLTDADVIRRLFEENARLKQQLANIQKRKAAVKPQA